MTLYTSDYLEYYLTLLGWLVHNGIWQMLVSTGLIALPFCVIIIQEWLRARSEGADEGNKGVLSTLRVENRTWAACVVILFAGLPIIPLDLNTLQFDDTRSSQCQVQVATPQETRWSTSFSTLNNQSAQVPIWWFFMHSVSKAVTGAAVAAIPCGTDLRQLRMDIDATRIHDPLLAQEVADFSHDCYGPARAKLFTQRPSLSEGQMSEVSWIGSRYFLTASGFYDTYRAKAPRNAWPYDANRDAGLPATQSGGFPTCSQWWEAPHIGLRARLLSHIDTDLLQKFKRWTSFLSQESAEDAMIRTVVSPRQQSLNQGQVYTDYGGQIGMSKANVATRSAGDLGLTVGALGFFPAMDVVRQALPMVLSFLKMALVICIPLVLVIGTFDLKATMTITCVHFALFFVDFWFQLARWLDSTILDALYSWNSPHSNFNPLMGLNNSFGDMLLNFVMATMFVVLPGFWVASLAWAGMRVGNIAQLLNSGSDDAKSAGGKGTGVAFKVVR
ncbi:conjugal transfer protein TraG N-terminal domain-containing protein [Pseudomonas huaxiensis]|uniref:conjugal transfer protein TraG N-terminal domain-containing protein n=1 Tax=Pseudomonas huaxiensis TaxID=2213017 RepID=UPI000DA6DAD0|nr:conjugal transfer protein TraG N-terminal domain-containing protein [Pseudomonas huaxiensis]